MTSRLVFVFLSHFKSFFSVRFNKMFKLQHTASARVLCQHAPTPIRVPFSPSVTRVLTDGCFRKKRKKKEGKNASAPHGSRDRRRSGFHGMVFDGRSIARGLCTKRVIQRRLVNASLTPSDRVYTRHIHARIRTCTRISTLVSPPERKSASYSSQCFPCGTPTFVQHRCLHLFQSFPIVQVV